MGYAVGGGGAAGARCTLCAAIMALAGSQRFAVLLLAVGHASADNCGMARPFRDVENPPYYGQHPEDLPRSRNGSCLSKPSTMSPLEELYRQLLVSKESKRNVRMLVKDWPAAILNAAITRLLITEVLGYPVRRNPSGSQSH